MLRLLRFVLFNLIKILWRGAKSICHFIILPYLYARELYLVKSKYNSARQKHDHAFVLLGMPTYGNLGDHAIGYAERTFFMERFPGSPTVSITDAEWRMHKKLILKLTRGDDTVVIIGGGFIGTLWMQGGELVVRDYINSFAQNRIIIFPQTVFFEQSPHGQRELENTKMIWQNHPNLTVCLREKYSYDFVLQNMAGGSFRRTALIPDIVLYLNRQESYKRSGILLILRSDKERVIGDYEKKKLLEILEKTGEQVKHSRMVLPVGIPESRSEKAVNQKFNEISRARLVVTDRLHGMVFSAVTGTPCIAVDNVSRKVEGVYRIVKECADYVRFAHSVDEIEALCKELLREKETKYRNENLAKYWDYLAKLAAGDE